MVNKSTSSSKFTKYSKKLSSKHSTYHPTFRKHICLKENILHKKRKSKPKNKNIQRKKCLKKLCINVKKTSYSPRRRLTKLSIDNMKSWSRQESKTFPGKFFWYNVSSKESLWEDETLPLGWGWCMKGYIKEYVHLKSGVRQKTFPKKSEKISSGLLICDTCISDTSISTYIPTESTQGLNVPDAIRSKRNFLFKDLVPDDKLWDLQVDDVSLFSITQGRKAEQMTKLIISSIRQFNDNADIKKTSFTLTDATACVGGNTISFAKCSQVIFVNAFEINKQRANMLKHNVDLVGLSSKTQIICGDFCKYFEIENLLKSNELLPYQDCIFIDPPWGGPDYYKSSSLDIFLGTNNLNDVVAKLLIQTKTHIVAIKTPINYNIKALQTRLECDDLINTTMDITNMRNMLLIIMTRIISRKKQRLS